MLACFNNDPRTLDDCKRFFPGLDTDLNVFPFRHPNVPDEAGPDGMLLWVALYPGVTANDLKSAATDLVQKANDAYAERLPLARIRTLRDEGMTHRAIADRLGLKENTVSAALKNPRSRTPESG